MAMEDAAALGRVLARAGGPKDLPSLTKLFADIRMDRAYEVQARSALNGRIWHCEWQTGRAVAGRV
jgi:salicylate hydroxylase